MLEMSIINVIFLTNVEKCVIFGLSQLLAFGLSKSRLKMTKKAIITGWL